MEFKIVNKLGGSSFKFIIFSIPAPKLTPIKSCGVIPINDPKKKFLTFTLNKTGKTFDIECAFIVGCNSIHTGKGMKAAPNGGFFDNVMDIFIVKNDVSRMQLMNIFLKVFKGEHIDLPYVHMQKATSLKIDALGDSLFNLDGDLIESSKVSVEVIPKAIKLLV